MTIMNAEKKNMIQDQIKKYNFYMKFGKEFYNYINKYNYIFDFSPIQIVIPTPKSRSLEHYMTRTNYIPLILDSHKFQKIYVTDALAYLDIVPNTVFALACTLTISNKNSYELIKLSEHRYHLSVVLERQYNSLQNEIMNSMNHVINHEQWSPDKYQYVPRTNRLWIEALNELMDKENDKQS